MTLRRIEFTPGHAVAWFVIGAAFALAASSFITPAAPMICRFQPPPPWQLAVRQDMDPPELVCPHCQDEDEAMDEEDTLEDELEDSMDSLEDEHQTVVRVDESGNVTVLHLPRE